jgi:adenylosuccinate synthase
MFWKSYLDNEQLLKEVQEVADVNQKSLKRIYNIEDYYENKLMPKLVSFPQQYLNRIKMIKH